MKITVTNREEIIYGTKERDEINLLFTGDLCPDAGIGELIRAGSGESLFLHMAPFIKRPDFSITNLECPLTESMQSIQKDGPSLIGPTQAARTFRQAGFDAVCLANNHIMDYGATGLEDTCHALEAEGLLFAGAGNNLESAQAPLLHSINGTEIAILNIAEREYSIAGPELPGAAPLDETLNARTILDVRNRCDVLILVIHGGHEFYPLPSPRMQETYRYLTDLGADLIVGHHAHAHTGYEIYKQAPIFYNIGNFLFDRKEHRDVWYKGYAVHVKLVSKKINQIFLIPYLQCKGETGLELLDDTELENFKIGIMELNGIIGDEKRLREEFVKFVRAHRIHYLTPFFGLNKIERQLLRMNLFPGFLLRKKRILNALTLVRCQSHREAFTEVLMQEIK